MKRFATMVGAAVLCLAGTARAQLVETTIPVGGNDLNWTATAGTTVGQNNGVMHVEAGWPGVDFTYLRGIDERTDLGFKVGFNYGFEGTTNGVFGVNLAVPVRRNLSRTDVFSIGVRAEPGLSFYGNNGSLLFGVGGPVGVVAGMKLDPRLTLDIGADLPILVSFANPAGVLFGPQVGGGGEYLLDKNLAVTLRARVGPEFALATGGTGSQAAFQTMIGIAYNMH